MKKILAWALLSCLPLCGGLQAEEFPVEEVIQMAECDQEVRLRWIRARNTDAAAEIAKEIRLQEQANTAHLKELLADGLPDIDEDDDLEDAITELVLRSSDLAFQKQFLEMISSHEDWADSEELTDRILLKEGLPQKYGTHLCHAKNFEPYPIEDLEKVDELRAEIDEESMEDYVEVTRTLAHVLEENNKLDFHKLLFHAYPGLIKKTEEWRPYALGDYLYYATFEKDGSPFEDEGFLAFEDPALAASYALAMWEPSNLFAEALYDKDLDNPELTVSIVIQVITNLEILNQPLYLYVVPREGFHVHEDFQFCYLDRIFVRENLVEPVAELCFDSVFEPILAGGGKIRILSSEGNAEIDSVNVEDDALCWLFFDITLENESA